MHSSDGYIRNRMSFQKRSEIFSDQLESNKNLYLLFQLTQKLKT